MNNQEVSIANEAGGIMMDYDPANEEYNTLPVLLSMLIIPCLQGHGFSDKCIEKYINIPQE